MDIRFTNELHPARHDELIDYLRSSVGMPHRHYPDYDDWLRRVRVELGTRQKRAIVAIDDEQIVGAIVYQHHQKEADVLEIRHLSVCPEMRGRSIASFMLRNLEIEGQKDFPGVTRVYCDAKPENDEIRIFLLLHDFVIVGTFDLYGLGAGEDMLFSKSLLTYSAVP